MAAIAALGATAFAYARGYELVAVQGASMGEALPLGSLAVVRRVPDDQVREGDVLLVRQRLLRGGTAAPFLHRVVALDRDGGRLVAETKGDANAKRDAAPYILPPRVAQARLHVPYAGYAAAVLAGPYVRMGLLAALVALVASAALRHILRAPLTASPSPGSVPAVVPTGRGRPSP